MNQSEQIDLLAAALVEYQLTAPDIRKNAINPHFKNRYADLSEVIETVRAPLAKAGLAVVQLPDGDDLITRLIHKSGQWISSRTALKCSKPDSQGYGSAISYSRRYALLAILSAAAEDDDAQAASASRPRPKVGAADVERVMAPNSGKKPEPYKMPATFSEADTRKKLAQMFTPGAVPYVLEWAVSPDRKSPTPADKFTATHFESLEKNRKVVEEYVEAKLFAEKNHPNHIDDEEAWAQEEAIL